MRLAEHEGGEGARVHGARCLDHLREGDRAVRRAEGAWLALGLVLG